MKKFIFILKKILLILGITLAVIFWLIVIGIILIIVFYKEDVSDSRKSFRSSYEITAEITDKGSNDDITEDEKMSWKDDDLSEEEKLKWYDSMEEALEDKEKMYDPLDNLLEQKIVMVEKDDEVIIFFVPRDEKKYFAYAIMKRDGERYSQPYLNQYYLLDYTYIDWNQRYDFDDTVAESIVEEFVIDDIRLEDKPEIYFGVYRNKHEVESLTIAGKKPEIVEFEEAGETWYMWYYTEADWIENLSVIDWGDFTLQQIIDCLPIEYDKEDSKN